MSGFTGLVLTEGHFVIKKMCGFRNIQIRVDGALMFNATLYMSEIQHSRLWSNGARSPEATNI